MSDAPRALASTLAPCDANPAPVGAAPQPETQAAAAVPVAAEVLPTTAAPVEPAPKPAPQKKAALDVAFCCDCTGSMGAYIRSAQDNIRQIARNIYDRKGQECSLRFALVCYRDHPPQDTSYVTTVFPFTKNIDVMQGNVDTMVASGGGDGPEAVAAGLKEVLDLNWNDEASKVVVFIADAPPHGLGESGDGFPNGCPDGNDPVQILRSMAERGITLYAIGVEPVLSQNYRFARDFMIMAATVTEGKFLPLGKADILTDVIVSTAIEGMELEQMWNNVEDQIKKDAEAANEKLSAEELCVRVEKRMAEVSHEVKVANVEVDTPYMDHRYDMSNAIAMSKAACLQDVVRSGKLNSAANAHVATETAAYNWQAQCARVSEEAPVSMEQCSRAACRGKKKMGFWEK